MHTTISIILMFVLSSCSLLKKNLDLDKYILIDSEPTGVEVYGSVGDKIGETPLKIQRDKLDALSKDGIVSLIFKKIGHRNSYVNFNNLGSTKLKVKMDRLTREEFQHLISGPLSNHVNDLIKDYMQSQESIVKGDYESARSRLDQIIKQYPTISSGYILRAAIEINKKNFQSAKRFLLKALNLDQSNEIAKAYLQYVEEGTNQ